LQRQKLKQQRKYIDSCEESGSDASKGSESEPSDYSQDSSFVDDNKDIEQADQHMLREFLCR